MQRFVALAAALALIALTGAQAVRAERPPAPTAQAGWQTVDLPGASCGRGAPYKYFLNPAETPDQPLIIYFEGGGACIKEGPAPAGASGIARNLYCMNYDKFVEPQPTFLPYYGLFRRDLSDNAFRAANYAFVPYCTGDLHAGTATTPYDYDPSPTATFNVLHRGHLNALAVLDDLTARFTDTTPILLTGSSAGGLGALYNFPEVIARWPDTTLVTDAGTLPDVAGSLVRTAMLRPTLPWQPRAILPDYCNSAECFIDTTRLLDAHAAHYDGDPAPWRPFGLLAGQQDRTQRSYMEVSKCSFQFALRRAVEGISAPNLRAFTPATELHTFLAAPPDIPVSGLGSYRRAIDGVTAMQWVAQLASAGTTNALPATATEPWPLCAGIHLPLLRRGGR